MAEFKELETAFSQHVGYISLHLKNSINNKVSVIKNKKLEGQINYTVNTSKRYNIPDYVLTTLRQWKEINKDVIHPFYALFFVVSEFDSQKAICSIYFADKSQEVNNFIGFPFDSSVAMYGNEIRSFALNNGFGGFVQFVGDLPSDNYLVKCVTEKKIYYVSDLEDLQDEYKGRITASIDRGAGLRSVVYAPVIKNDACHGIVVFYSPLTHIFGQHAGQLEGWGFESSLSFNLKHTKEGKKKSLSVDEVILSIVDNRRRANIAEYFSKKINNIFRTQSGFINEARQSALIARAKGNIDEIISSLNKDNVFMQEFSNEIKILNRIRDKLAQLTMGVVIEVEKNTKEIKRLTLDTIDAPNPQNRSSLKDNIKKLENIN